MPIVREAIEKIVYPQRSETLRELGLIREISEREVHITLPSPAIPRSRETELRELIEKAAGSDVIVHFHREQAAAPRGLGSNLLESAKNIIAVASGKGGVGKSTVACNLAAALAASGCSVGLLDADVYGPSQPLLLGVAGTQLKIKDKRILPVEAHGLSLMSMGFLMKPGDAVIWRGPMLHGMMQQFCRDVEWGELDFIVVDLPPGTGDIALSLSQLIDVTGSVIVSTPQDLALDVATKAVGMFNKLGVPILGLVENMSYYCCPQCNHRDDIFNHGGAHQAARTMNLPVLGEVPLNSAIRKAGDVGVPVVLHEPDSAPAKVFTELAQSVAERVSLDAQKQILTELQRS
ncbi:MAG: Mrp/NBP35 family ATP-binding protein [Vulcanimicrobiota bacterium]